MSDLSARQRLDTPRTSRRRFSLNVDAETVVPHKTITERMLRQSKASFVYSVKL